VNPFNSKILLETAGLPRGKRALDIGLILLAAPILLPLAVLIGIIIRLVSKGPILFQQERVGYLGEKFMCLKFRTMFVGADSVSHQGHLYQLISSDGPMIKMDEHGDSRIILFGRWLRSSGLDELPQLINVLRGEMSLVGPRPCLPYESDKYLPWQKDRFLAMPGLTGLWQVSGKNRTTFVEMMRLDIKYVGNKSLWLDLKIILKTIPVLMIQMWDSRKKRKSLLPTAQPKAALQLPVVNQSLFRNPGIVVADGDGNTKFTKYHDKTN
jgi:lipopolysaccharide/colanic/teichoic acid biosynthesis glycosyltransferase